MQGTINPSRFMFACAVMVCSWCLASPAQAITAVNQVRNDGTLNDGGDDQFDPPPTFNVDGVNYVATISGGAPNFAISSQQIGEIEVSAQVRFLVENGTTSANTVQPGEVDFVYARQLYQFTNTGVNPITFPVVISWDFGSDSQTVVHATSSGDNVIAADDLWTVTDDGVDGGPAVNNASVDPAVALLVADGSGQLPATLAVPSMGQVEATFSISLEPGETKSLLLFSASRNETDTFPQTASRAQSQADIEALLADPVLQFRGLDQAIRQTVVNFAPPFTDIEITSEKLAGTTEPVIAGSGSDNLEYRFTVTNTGLLPASNLVVNQAVLSNFAPGCGISVSEGGFASGVWTIGDLAAAASVTMDIQCTVAASVPSGATYRQTLTVASLDQDDPDDTNDSSFQESTVARLVDLEMTASDSPDPVVAGSGFANLVHVLTVTNNGPSDAANVNVAVVPTLPAGVNLLSIIPSAGGYSPGPNTWVVGDLAAGASANLTITATVTLAAEEGTDVVSAQGTATSDESDTNPDNNEAADPTSIRWPTATFEVSKDYSGTSGPAVDVELACSDASGLLVYEPQSGTTPVSLVVRRFDIDPAGNGTQCTITETLPDGYFEVSRTADCDVGPAADQGDYACTLTNAQTIANVRVTKEFTDGDNPTEVTVSLDCNTGLILDQDKSIVEGDANFVSFVITSFTDGELDCHVVEDADALPGYSASYSASVIFQQDDDDVGYASDEEGCHFSAIPGGAELSCNVINDARPQPVTVTKEWIFEGSVASSDIDTGYTLTLHCDAKVIQDGNYGCSRNDGMDQVNGDSGDKLYRCKRFHGNGDGDFTALVVPTYPGNTCWVTEEANTQFVESDITDCGNLTVSAVDGGDACIVTNTVFFEGIPTLSQYGLALMTLLMLGMGLVGFRRYG